MELTDLPATKAARARKVARVRAELRAWPVMQAEQCHRKSYQIRPGGLVLDDATGLTWQQNVGGRNRPNDATTYCAGFGTGWRLPSLTELQTIVDDTKFPSIDETAFPNTPSGVFLDVLRDDSRHCGHRVGRLLSLGRINPSPKPRGLFRSGVGSLCALRTRAGADCGEADEAR